MSEERSIREIRLEKLARLRELGCDPYAVERFPFDKSAKQLIDDFQDGAEVRFAGRLVSMRLMGKAAFAHISDGDGRIQGYFKKDLIGDTPWEVFNLLDIGDHVGVSGTLFVTKTGEKSIQVAELTPLSKSLQTLPLGKEKDGQTWYGLSDVEMRYRHRHLDLVVNPEAREKLLNRSRIVSAVRRYFDQAGFFEVETPLLQLEAGGAAARPFLTHYNAYDIDVKLRISLELYLKRIICGDVPKVYEIGRVFRNEGVSNRHNPEFTLIEWYEAYANLEDNMTRVEELFRSVAESVFGSAVISMRKPISDTGGDIKLIDPHERVDIGASSFYKVQPEDQVRAEETLKESSTFKSFSGNFEYRVESGRSTLWSVGTRRVISVETDTLIHRLADGGHLDQEGSGLLTPGHWCEMMTSSHAQPQLDEIDFGKPWARIDLLTEIEKHTGLTAEDLSSIENAKAALSDRLVSNPVTGKRITVDTEAHLGGLIEKLLEVFIEPHLQEPTFVVGYPIETSPLAKKDPNRAGFTRRFEGYVLGREVCNSFSEINDPLDQRERFEQQMREAAKGDDEAHPMDEEFIYAMEGGMPPCGGVGIGIDRMVMLLTGSEHLREILLFPMMRPHGHTEEED